VSELGSKLFIHSLEADRLGDGLGEGLGPAALRMLSSRAALLSHPKDTVIVDSAPDPAWISFLADQGIEIGAVEVANGYGDTLAQRVMADPDLMNRLGGKRWSLEPYMGGSEIEQLATMLGAKLNAPHSPHLERLNLKSNLQSILTKIDLPKIPTMVAGREDVAKVARMMLNDIGSIMVRSDLSIGGHGVWKLEQESEIESLELGIHRSDPSRLFILQPLLDVANSPNVQYSISETDTGFLGVSAQQMTQSFAFGGNDFPSPFSNDPVLRLQADNTARWLQAEGYRGIVGIDFIVTTDGQVYIVEINPRVNTSSFPLVLSKRLGKSAFKLMTEIPAHGVVGFEQLASFLGEDLLFDAQKGSGILPLMTPAANRPVLDAMVFADDLETANRISQELLRRADVAGVHAGAGEPS